MKRPPIGYDPIDHADREGQPRPPLDPDPLYVEGDELWDPAAGAWVPRPSALPALLAGLIYGLVAGVLLGVLLANHAFAASPGSAESPGYPARLTPEAPLSLPGSDPAGLRGDGGSIPQAVQSGASRSPAAQVPAPSAASTLRSGIASFVAPSLGPRYLALPEGPGATVRVCGKASCIRRTSTDAGPDLAMQRRGRIADLSFRDFATVCGCDPWAVGLTRVTVEHVGPATTTPPTDIEP